MASDDVPSPSPADPFATPSIATVDVGPLRHDIFRTAGRPEAMTALRRALFFGTIRVFTTPRVIQEVERRLAFFATKEGVEEAVAWQVWGNDYRRYLWVVDVDDLDAEIGGHPHVVAVRERHPNDLSLALLTALLGVQAWAEDGDFGALGTGRKLWLQHTLATVDAKRYGDMSRAGTLVTAETVTFAGKQAVRAYKGVEAKIGRGTTVLALLLVVVGIVWFLSDDRRRRAFLQSPITRGIGITTRTVVTTLAETHARYQTASAFLQGHQRNDPRPPSAVMRIARELAAARVPLTEADIARRTVISREAVAVLLRNHAAFVARPDGRWQFGRCY